MGKNTELENLKKIDSKKKKKVVDKIWIIKILIITFIVSLGMSFLAESTVPKFNLVVAIIVSLVFIFLGVIFDIVGVAVTAASEKVFHSMNSRRVKGATLAVKFKTNSDKVSSFCCDVIGDICGVISGTTALTIAIFLSDITGIDRFLLTLIVTAIIASLTIGGKAIGKSFAIKNSDVILYEFAKFISNFYKA